MSELISIICQAKRWRTSTRMLVSSARACLDAKVTASTSGMSSKHVSLCNPIFLSWDNPYSEALSNHCFLTDADHVAIAFGGAGWPVRW